MGNEMWVIVVLEAEWAIRRCGGGQKQNNEIIVPLSHITSSTSVFFQSPQAIAENDPFVPWLVCKPTVLFWPQPTLHLRQYQ